MLCWQSEINRGSHVILNHGEKEIFTVVSEDDIAMTPIPPIRMPYTHTAYCMLRLSTNVIVTLHHAHAHAHAEHKLRHLSNNNRAGD